MGDDTFAQPDGAHEQISHQFERALPGGGGTWSNLADQLKPSRGIDSASGGDLFPDGLMVVPPERGRRDQRHLTGSSVIVGGGVAAVSAARSGANGGSPDLRDAGNDLGQLRASLVDLIDASHDQAAGWFFWNFGHAADALLAAGWRPPPKCDECTPTLGVVHRGHGIPTVMVDPDEYEVDHCQTQPRVEPIHDAACTRANGVCMSYHCPVCGKSCNSQGHPKCQAVAE